MCLYPFAGQLARFITGHEITHCFDDQGVAFLPEFTGKPKQGFQRLCGAMKQWSSAQCNSNCCVDAELTLGENTADLIGFRICLRHFLNAFERDMHRDVSKKELMQFYVDYAAMWAARCSPQIKMMRKIRDAHEDPATRILMATTPLPPCPCQDNKSNV
jgi:predicted metalloendopeptidase